ncbi:MAG: rRNA adenine N-6-methyltransferase family protein, partial [Desulfuromonadales bacterium]
MLTSRENNNISSVETLPDYQLDNLEGMYNYYNWIMTLFAPHLGERILEIGAGTGTFSRLLASHNSVVSLVLVEPDPRLNIRLMEDFEEDDRVVVVSSTIEEMTA